MQSTPGQYHAFKYGHEGGGCFPNVSKPQRVAGDVNERYTLPRDKIRLFSSRKKSFTVNQATARALHS